MPTSAVVDASVLVSAFLFPGSVPGRVLKLADQGAFALHLSPLLLEETRYALLSTRLRDAYGHDEESVTAWCADLQEVGSVFYGLPPDIGPACRDPMTIMSLRPLLRSRRMQSSPGTRICWRSVNIRPCAFSRHGLS
jgi:predicted nucleic acid-binding protein